MRIINERRSQIDGNALISCILEYNSKLFKISDCPTKLFIWSELNGWLFIDYGDTKETTQKSIEQFLSIMKAYTNENI
jgi:hypothetical protein